MKTLPIYIVSGMIESSKTSFILETIKSDDFYKKNKTLILVCEEGEISYDENFLTKYNCVVRYFSSIEEFSALSLQEAVLDEMPSRVVIELNGMWNINLISFPDFFKIQQFIYFINYETFPIYFANMRQQFLDYVKQADVTVFINVNDNYQQLQEYSNSFKLTNSNCQYMIMDKQGRLTDAFEVELPYNIDDDIIKINDDDYGIFYIDSYDNKEKYEGKTIEFNAMVVLAPSLPKHTFIAGRLAMTCCSNDIQLYGHLTLNNSKHKLIDRGWVHIIAKIKIEYSHEYQEDEIVLYPISIEKIKEIKNPILDLTK